MCKMILLLFTILEGEKNNINQQRIEQKIKVHIQERKVHNTSNGRNQR